MMPRRVIVMLFLLGVTYGACRLQSPQLEGLQRALDEPRQDRLQTYDACHAAAASQSALIECMAKKGYVLAPNTGDSRSDHCRSLLESATDYPKAFCFEKAK